MIGKRAKSISLWAWTFEIILAVWIFFMFFNSFLIKWRLHAGTIRSASSTVVIFGLISVDSDKAGGSMNRRFATRLKSVQYKGNIDGMLWTFSNCRAISSIGTICCTLLWLSSLCFFLILTVFDLTILRAWGLSFISLSCSLRVLDSFSALLLWDSANVLLA